MLVLSRKLGEVVLINPGTPDEIRVTVVDLDRGRIRLGFEAPARVAILREELYGLPPRDPKPAPKD